MTSDSSRPTGARTERRWVVVGAVRGPEAGRVTTEAVVVDRQFTRQASTALDLRFTTTDGQAAEAHVGYGFAIPFRGVPDVGDAVRISYRATDPSDVLLAEGHQDLTRAGVQLALWSLVTWAMVRAAREGKHRPRATGGRHSASPDR